MRKVCIIYTDGSWSSVTKLGGCGVVAEFDGQTVQKAIPAGISKDILSVELRAVLEALTLVFQRWGSLDGCVVNTDSRPVVALWKQIEKNPSLENVRADLQESASRLISFQRKTDLSVEWCRGHRNLNTFSARRQALADNYANKARLSQTV